MVRNSIREEYTGISLRKSFVETVREHIDDKPQYGRVVEFIRVAVINQMNNETPDFVVFSNDKLIGCVVEGERGHGMSVAYNEKLGKELKESAKRIARDDKHWVKKERGRYGKK